MTCALVPLWTYLAYFAFRVLPTFTSPAVTSNTLISLLRLPVFMGAVLCRKSSKFCHNPPPDLKTQNKSSDNAEENGIMAVSYFRDTYFSTGDGAINYRRSVDCVSFLRIGGDLSKSPYN